MLVLQGSPHIVDEINNKKVSLVFNTTETPQAIKDSKSIRRSSLESNTPYYTTVSGAKAAVSGIKAIKNQEINVETIQSYEVKNWVKNYTVYVNILRASNYAKNTYY